MLGTRKTKSSFIRLLLAGYFLLCLADGRHGLSADTEKGTVCGRIVHLDNATVEGIELTLRGLGNNFLHDPENPPKYLSQEVLSTKTDKDGYFAFSDVKPGAYRLESPARLVDTSDQCFLEALRCDKRGNDLPEVHVLPGKQRTLDMLYLMRLGWKLEGNLLLPENHAGAKLFWQHPPGAYHIPGPLMHTPEYLRNGDSYLVCPPLLLKAGLDDVCGVAWLRAIPDVAALRIYLSEDRYVMREITVVPGGRNKSDLDLRTVGWGTVAGKVSLTDGAPAAGAGVLLYREGSRYPFATYSAGTAGKEGEFKIGNVECGKYEAWAVMTGYPPAKLLIVVETDRPTTVNLVLNAAGTGKIELAVKLSFEEYDYIDYRNMWRAGSGGQQGAFKLAAYLLPRGSDLGRPYWPRETLKYNGAATFTIAGIEPGDYDLFITPFSTCSEEAATFTSETDHTRTKAAPLTKGTTYFTQLPERVLPRCGPSGDGEKSAFHWTCDYFRVPVSVRAGETARVELSDRASLDWIRANWPLATSLFEKMRDMLRSGFRPPRKDDK